MQKAESARGIVEKADAKGRERGGDVMTGTVMGFSIWALVGLFFIGNGIWCFGAKKASGFWANAKTPAIEDIKSYNRAMGKLWCVYGFVMILLGLPLLFGSGAWIMASVVGIMVETIGAMVVYIVKIEPRYRKK